MLRHRHGHDGMQGAGDVKGRKVFSRNRTLKTKTGYTKHTTIDHFIRNLLGRQ